MHRLLLAALAALALLCLPAGAGADHSTLRLVTPGTENAGCDPDLPFPPHPAVCRMRLLGVSTDGRRIIFSTQDRLVPGDLDDRIDLYHRSNGVITLLSEGPKEPSFGFDAITARMSAYGTSVAFSTPYPLLAEDTDSVTDIYRWTASGGLRLLTPGTSRDMTLGIISRDGRRVYFATQESLDPRDLDVDGQEGAGDLYEWADGNIRVISTGPADDGLDDVETFVDSLSGTTEDERIFFVTGERLVPEDTGGASDVYERAGDRVTLVSTGPEDDRRFASADPRTTPDGKRVFFESFGTLVAEDRDHAGPRCGNREPLRPCRDIYERSGGATRLVTKDVTCACDVNLSFVTPDGAVFARTTGQLVPEDQNTLEDLYRLQDGTFTLVSADENGKAGSMVFGIRATPDGSHVVFMSAGRLTSGDTDNNFDIYERLDSETRLVSTGPLGGAPPFCCTPEFGPISADGSRVFFMTLERHVPDDPDEFTWDVYERHEGVTTLVSKHAAGPPLLSEPGSGGPGISADGRRIFFTDLRRLAPGDVDDRRDIYEAVASDPPDCSAAQAKHPTIGRGDGSFVRLKIRGVSDPDGDPVTISVDSVTQDEPVRDKRDRTSPDARRRGDSVWLRTERNPKGDGRVYRVAFAATDDFDMRCTGEVTVEVRRHWRKPAVDSAPPAYDSFGS